MPDATAEFIFVYGTLRRGFNSPVRALFARYCQFVANCTLQGRLYDLGFYPGVVESGRRSEQVYGEVYRVKDTHILAVLDEYEGCSVKNPAAQEYLRKKLTVQTNSGTELSAWVYVYNQDVSKLKRIRSGDYLR